jgi:small subunit ribosomal protein S20
MPIIASAKKALKRSKVLHERNEHFKIAMKKSLKAAKKMIETTPTDKSVEGLVKSACIAIDKAAKTKIIHPNNAARKKSRLMAMAHKAK